MLIWLGLHKHKKDILKDAPKGFQIVSIKFTSEIHQVYTFETRNFCWTWNEKCEYKIMNVKLWFFQVWITLKTCFNHFSRKEQTKYLRHLPTKLCIRNRRSSSCVPTYIKQEVSSGVTRPDCLVIWTIICYNVYYWRCIAVQFNWR